MVIKMKRFFARRRENTTRYRKFNCALLLLYPVFLVLLCEFNHLQSVSSLLHFCTAEFSVFLFDILLIGAIYAAILIAFTSGLAAVLTTGVPLFVMSFVEFYKYKSSGAHFVLSDIFMAGNTSQLMKFAGVKLNIYLVIDICVFLAYILLVFWFNPRFVVAKRGRRVLTAVGCTVMVGTVIMTPLSNVIYSVFALDYQEATNNYECNDKFETNNMVAYLAQTSSEQILNAPTKPDGYSEDYIQNQLSKPKKARSWNAPNVVMIMSESYADFRRIDPDNNWDDYYKNFDQFAEEGTKGTCVVPTFGNTTVRTEFELMFGLPVRSLNDSSTPQNMLRDDLDVPQATFADYYKSQGYHTAYIHPFLSDFYGRNEIYSNFNFDTLKFKDDLTVPTNYYRQYIDDQTDFNQILDELREASEPCYIYTSTMQNHQPYNLNDDQTEYEYYMDGIKKTDQALSVLMRELKQLDEPTIVLFVGDHYPYFTGTNTVYDKAGIDSGNAYLLYQQPYLIWNNYGLEVEVPELVSAFYLPHLLVRLTGGEQTAFISTMLDQMAQQPVYSSNYITDIAPNKLLDDLTYDRVQGNLYSR